ncbi:RHS repeat domain-containing protein [Chryseobacterium sp. CT-SW4]|uniref:RHS repeat domain-containing protein n=1 Tax=Chryseobacterium sp. SW-1 TaxID=3157343 RepID=UPI003B019DBB
MVRDNTTGKEKHVLYIGGSPYESNIVYLKNYTESSGSYKFLHKDYIGSILAISDEAGNKLEQRHFDAWDNFTHLQIGNGAIVTDKNVIDNSSLLIERGYTSHEHFAEVGIIHMNGRLYDPLLRRFLNADENIQDPYNTQNYNKYGYALNNPLMYADPSGEFFWIIAGAVAGAYLTGVKANGSWNPTKWNWGATWGKIVMGGAIGAFTGGVGAAVGSSAAIYAAGTLGIQGGILGGAIAGAAGGAVAGAINGFATAVMFGENALQGTFSGLASGAIGGAVLGGIAGGVQTGLKNPGLPDGQKLNMWTGKAVAEGRSAWAFNNVSKTTTVGATAKVSSSGIKYTITAGEVDGSAEKIIGYNINPQTEQMTPITKWGDFKVVPGQQPYKFHKDFSSMMEPSEAIRYAKYWTGYSPKQITPGINRLDWQRISGRTGQLENSRVIYDKFGRQIYRVDFSDHLRPENHSIPHLHQYEYGPGFSDKGKETLFNFWKE